MPLSALSEPARLDLKIVTGDSFSRTLRFLSDGAPVDLTGYTGRAQVRDRPAGKLLATFTVTIPTPTNGEVIIALDTTATRGLAAGVWDLELDAGPTATHTVVQGAVKVLADITVAPPP